MFYRGGFNAKMTEEEKRPFLEGQCALCRFHTKLTVCEECMQKNIAMTMARIMEDTTNEKIRIRLDILLDEVRELKEELRKTRLKNMKIKPDISKDWGEP